MNNKISLSDRMKMFYEDKTRYYLHRKTNVIIRLDGRAFSKFCKRFVKPYDETFINMMNETAQYLCENVECCKFAYVQSDEISLYINDYENENSDAWFGYNIQKISSISSSLATAKFNQLLMIQFLEKSLKLNGFINEVNTLKKEKLVEFDSRVFTIPQNIEVYNYFLWRQIDCIRNSKQMAAQTYIPHENLVGLHTDQQIDMLNNIKGINWNDFSNDKKFGRFLYKENVEIPYNIPEKFKNGKIPSTMLENLITEDTDEGVTNYYIMRNKWVTHNGFKLTNEEGKQQFYNIMGWQ